MTSQKSHNERDDEKESEKYVPPFGNGLANGNIHSMPITWSPYNPIDHNYPCRVPYNSEPYYSSASHTHIISGTTISNIRWYTDNASSGVVWSTGGR